MIFFIKIFVLILNIKFSQAKHIINFSEIFADCALLI